MNETKKKVAVDHRTGDITAFKYQSANTEVEVEDHEYENEEVFTEQQISRFRVVGGIVVRRTDEEIKKDPTYNKVIDEQRQFAYSKEIDGLQHKAIRLRRRGDLEGASALDKQVDTLEEDIKKRFPKV